MMRSILGLVVMLFSLAACASTEDAMVWEPDDEGVRNDTSVVKRGWSASGTLRRENRNKLVSLQAAFASAETYTIQFSIVYPEVPAGATATTETKAVAEIAWSVSGNTVYRKVTVANGTSISGVAQGVQVRIYDETQPTGDPSSEGWEYEVSVQVSPGVRASDDIPPVYYPAQDVNGLPANFSRTYDVDPKLGAKSVFVGPRWATVGGRGYIIMSGNQGGVTIATFSLTEPGVWLPLAPGCDQVMVQNAAGSSQVTLSVMFGIDG